MLSMGLGIECQANLNASVLRQKLPQQKHKLLLVNNNQRALNFKPRTSTFSVSHSLPELKLRLTQTTRNVKLSAAAESLVAEETAAADDNLTTETPLEKEPLLFLAEERCLGGAQGLAREQAMDISKADDYSSQPGY
ncbi:hypothetical protein GBA52_011683 [Prunus armeniaca]|nr:hypothetical protein GBA52_011683 [Prunus armeniaca]